MDLQRMLPKATPRMLSQQLHDLEECGLIRREAVPPKTSPDPVLAHPVRPQQHPCFGRDVRLGRGFPGQAGPYAGLLPKNCRWTLDHTQKG